MGHYLLNLVILFNFLKGPIHPPSWLISTFSWYQSLALGTVGNTTSRGSMESSGFSILPECPPLNKPPGFNGQHYTFWKQKMRDFIEASDIDMWELVENGYNPPSRIENGISIFKPRSEWTDDEKKKHLLASKVKWIISNSLWPSEYERVSNCSTAKEIWDTLEIAHVGTTQVKASKVHTLVSQYELFKMNDGESIKDMVQRFTAIINHLSILGRKFDNADLVHKVLRSLTIEWQPKITAIKESMKMGVPTLQELFGNLEDHEMELKRYSKNDEEKRRRGLALKATVNLDDEEEDSESLEENNEDDELALLTKKYQRFLRTKRGFGRRGDGSKKFNNRNDQGNSSAPTCYECKKQGHIKSDCPTYLKKLLESEKKRNKQPYKRAHLAAWGNDEDGSDCEESKDEEALLCLMAVNNEVIDFHSAQSDNDNDIDDLYSELYDDLIKAKKSANLSKKIISSLESNSENLQKENDDLLKEIQSLKSSLPKVCSNCEKLQSKIDDLNKTLEKFTNGKKNLETLIGSQRCTFNKEGLGFIPGNSKGLYKNLFVRKTIGNQPHITCFYCRQKGHGIHSCVYKRKQYTPQVGEKLVWMPKTNNSPKTNSVGPKTIWVPISKT